MFREKEKKLEEELRKKITDVELEKGRVRESERSQEILQVELKKMELRQQEERSNWDKAEKGMREKFISQEKKVLELSAQLESVRRDNE